jgi:hypothetical protein
LEIEMRDNIMTEINAERERQVELWGNDSDDSRNTPFHYVSYIASYATKWMAGTWAPFRVTQVDAFRTAMIKVAALAISAVESLDRQRAEDGTAFYETPNS